MNNEIISELTEYEERWRGYMEHIHEKLLQVLEPDLHKDDKILDVSGGTGGLAKLFIDRKLMFGEYVLNDISPRNLGRARERLPSDSRVHYTSYATEEIPFEENRFTKVICLNALHTYPHPSRSIRRFKDVLKPNGNLYLLDWNRFGWFIPINSLINWLGNSTGHTLSRKEAEKLLREHRYRIDHSEQWRYKYWRLYLIVGGFKYWMDR